MVTGEAAHKNIARRRENRAEREKGEEQRAQRGPWLLTPPSPPLPAMAAASDEAIKQFSALMEQRESSALVLLLLFLFARKKERIYPLLLRAFLVTELCAAISFLQWKSRSRSHSRSRSAPLAVTDGSLPFRAT